jgi:hypothetical protein
MEDTKTSGLKVALKAFIGASGGSKSSAKKTKTAKSKLRAENMIREIAASLNANGTLCRSMTEAVKRVNANRGAVWVEARHPFSVPLRFDYFNEVRGVTFLAGFPPYDDPAPKITMFASLNQFPSVEGGQLSVSGHDALFFRQLGGAPYEYTFFGSFFKAGENYQVKPYAIHQ